MKGRIYTGLIILVSWYIGYLVLFDSTVQTEAGADIQHNVVEDLAGNGLISSQVAENQNLQKRSQPDPVSLQSVKPRKRTVVKVSRSITRPDNATDISVDLLLGKVRNIASNNFFVKIDNRLTANGQTLYMRKEAYIGLIKMYKAALKDGVQLKVLSALRTFYHQKYIWDNKWIGNRSVEGRNLALTEKNLTGRAMIILKYSSMPGTSRHHWGTDVDFNALDNAYFEHGEGKIVYDWLVKNAARFGFAQTYTKKDHQRPRGYSEEKWHWSYLPMARNFLYQYSTKINYGLLTGFEGSEVAPRLRVIPNYVLSINPDCK